MNCEVIFAGFGGQGVLTAGLVLAQMGIDAGLEVLWSPAYGGEMRGGKAYSMVKLSDAPILEPMCTALTVLAAMNGPALDFCSMLRPGGLLVVSEPLCAPLPETGDFAVLRAPMQAMAEAAGNPRGANLAAAGCVAGALRWFSQAEAAESARRFFEKKGKAALGGCAAAAVSAGYEQGRASTWICES